MRKLKIRHCKVCNVELVDGNWYPKPAHLLCKKHYKEKKSVLAKKYFKSEKGKAVTIKRNKEMKLKYPEKFNSRMLTHHAIKIGIIVRKPCVVCGEIKVEGHHVDYKLPYVIVWLCMRHHTDYHMVNKVVVSLLANLKEVEK